MTHLLNKLNQLIARGNSFVLASHWGVSPLMAATVTLTAAILGSLCVFSGMGESRLELFWRIFALLPPVLVFLIFRTRSRLLATAGFLAAATVTIFLLVILSVSAEKKLMQTDHAWNALKKTEWTDKERSQAKLLFERQRVFLSSYQRCTAVGIGSVFAIFGLHVLSVSKRKLPITIGITLTACLLFVLGGLFLPGPITGSWSGNLGCMTCTYHFSSFTDTHVTHNILCASSPLDFSSPPKGYYSRKSIGCYIWYLEGNHIQTGEDKPLTAELKISPFLMIMNDSGDKSLRFLGWRNIDYLTQAKFKNYLEWLKEMKRANK